MSNVKITVGGDFEKDAARRFVDAWHRAERGESFRERHLAFESWDALARVLTGKRMELLHYVRRHKVNSVRALTKANVGICRPADIVIAIAAVVSAAACRGC